MVVGKPLRAEGNLQVMLDAGITHNFILLQPVLTKTCALDNVISDSILTIPA